jgi:D-glycero-D-manno-heptose 1,7-bisphosphate phosphatase
MNADEIAELCTLVPGTLVHADLAAFAEHVIQQERKGRAHPGESDSAYGRLD